MAIPPHLRAWAGPSVSDQGQGQASTRPRRVFGAEYSPIARRPSVTPARYSSVLVPSAQREKVCAPRSRKRGTLSEILRSYPRRERPGPILQELVELDLRKLARQGLLPKTEDPRRLGPAHLPKGVADLEINRHQATIITEVGRRQILPISLQWLCLRGLRGKRSKGDSAFRLRFVCPCCSIPRHRIFDYEGQWRCQRCMRRRAIGGRNLSQVLSPKGRRGFKIKKKRAACGEYPGLSPMHRRKRQHHQSYNKQQREIRYLESKPHSSRSKHFANKRAWSPFPF
jgi:hypothetical protein